MARQFSLSYELPPIGLLPPAADAAGRTSAYHSLKNCAGKAYLVCRVNQGNAAQVTFTPLQATDVSGSGSKVISATQIFLAADTATADALVRQTDGANFQTSATLKDKIVVFEFDTSELDVANGFDCIAIQTSASNAANITAAEMLYKPRYAGATQPSSLAN